MRLDKSTFLARKPNLVVVRLVINFYEELNDKKQNSLNYLHELSRARSE